MIYLDHNATTIIHPLVQELMVSLVSKPLNPSSIHGWGRESKNFIEQARKRIEKLIRVNKNSQNYQIIFTSSGTEANNLILTNFSDADIFISAVEHVSIFEQQKYFANIKIVPVNNQGIIDLEAVKNLLQNSNNPKKLISVILANNETGVIQPLKDLAKIAKEFNTPVHSDCVQAIGKIEVNIVELGIDFATLSAHKFGGPVGAAALIANTKYPLRPMIIGGGQEQGIRSGTENVIAIAGLGLAASLADQELIERSKQMIYLQQKLEQGLANISTKIKIIADTVNRLPNTSLIIVPKSDAAIQVIAFDLENIAVSAGSACSSGKVGKSHVLSAMQIPESDAKSAIRISLSHTQKEEEIDYFLKIFRTIYEKYLN